MKRTVICTKQYTGTFSCLALLRFKRVESHQARHVLVTLLFPPAMVPLRILYTINSSPQYILAKSTSPVKVIPVSYNPKYATTSLKASLDFICHSSPELLQHPERDFSVYILDPLESHSAPAPVSISTPSASTSTACIPTTGVAVALGLMSSARSPSTDIPVTGTLITLGTGQQALEVIFALREVRLLILAITSLYLPFFNRRHANLHAHALMNQTTATKKSRTKKTRVPLARNYPSQLPLLHAQRLKNSLQVLALQPISARPRERWADH